MTSAHFWEIFLPPSCQQFFFTLEMSAQFGDDVIYGQPLWKKVSPILQPKKDYLKRKDNSISWRKFFFFREIAT